MYIYSQLQNLYIAIFLIFKMILSRVNCILIASILLFYASEAIEQVDDSDLLHLLTGEENIVALFTKENCVECEELETTIDNVQGELKENLNAIVIKAHNSHMVRVYDPSGEPALVYFRKGIPLLYYGEIAGEQIIETFAENKVPVVKELSDENFEHLTQSATGATTGDWFIFFYSADCVLCQRLYAVWEGVGAKLKRRLNVARVNRLEVGLSTAKRFGITNSPEFIYLRQGKMYPYKSKEYTPKSFIEFAEIGYQQQKDPQPVPPIPSIMNDILADSVHFLSDNKINVSYVLAVLLILTIMVIIIRMRSGKLGCKKKNAKKAK